MTNESELKKVILEKQFSKFMKLTISGIRKDYKRRENKHTYREIPTECLESITYKVDTEFGCIEDCISFSVLDGLSPNEKKVIYLTVISDMTERKTAEVMSVSQQAVHKLKKKSLSKLRSLLSDHYG